MRCLPAAWVALAAIAWAVEPVAPRLVWTGPGVTLLGGPSRDGRYLSFADPRSGNLAIREIATGSNRALTSNASGSKEFAYFSAIAPDSKRVAYAWFNADGYYDLRVIGLDGTGMRVLYRNEEAGFVQPCAWSSDSKYILTLFFRADNISQIALVPADGGAPKTLRSLNWVYPKRMDLSPDGRHVVYDSFAGESGGDRTIYLLSVDGARERRLVSQPGNHLFPLWMPDGKRVVYGSDRSGTMDIWEVAVEDGVARGEPRLVRRDVGRFLPMGITTGGEFYYGLRSGSTDVFVTTLEAPARDARRATLRFPGRNSSPEWSADGKSLAYLSRRGSENFGQESRAIVIRSLEAGVEVEAERELQPKLAYIGRARWAPNGKALLASGSDSKGRGGLYSIDARTAELKPLVVETGAPFAGFEGVWSPDGASIFYIRGSELRSREIASGREATVYRGGPLGHLTVSPDGKWLAIGSGASVLLIPAAGESRTVAFEGLTALEWGRALIAGRGAELWRIPTDGGAPVKLNSPGNRSGGFSLHPDGARIALTTDDVKAEVWAVPLR
jgi:Tol biopolymer transport system component